MKSPSLLGALAACVIGCVSLQAHAASAADPQKVLRYIFPAAETGFDPAMVHDLYSAHVNQAIFESLYTYDYMARPAKLMPQTADGLPEITDGGKTYTIRLKKGIYFADDPAFNGKRRELTMADYVYTFKRLFDPKLASPNTWLFQGKVIGLDQIAEDAKKSGKFNVDAAVEGFELIDPYTLRIRLTQPDFNLGMSLAHNPTGAMAREVVEKYATENGQVMANPVGTGPYKLTQWVRGSRIILEANPDYRGKTWDFAAGSDPDDARIVKQMQGKRLPQIGRVEISVIIEDQSRLLSFQYDQIDLFQLSGPLAPRALTADGKLNADMTSKGVQMSRIVDPEISYYYWNMRDPVLGGFAKEKIALRRAIAMAYNVEEEIKIIWKGQAVALDYPVPPGVVGHDPSFKSVLRYDPVAANALLDKFGYKKGKDGFRTLPDGKPLSIRYTSRNETNGQLQAETWNKTYASIGIRMEGDRRPFPDILKAEKQCQLQTRTNAWVADYPDGDNFMMLFAGKNIHQNNNGCFQHPEYDKLYAQSQVMPSGPERDVLYRKMARILDVNAGARIGYARYRTMLAQARVLGFKKHPILNQEWMYIDIEKGK